MNEEWYKVDNVSKVFLANNSTRNPQTLRVSCTLKEMVDPVLLQKALDATVVSLPELQLRVRRGFFWHYLEKTSVEPIVEPESGRPCPVLYGRGYHGYLHYKVSYYKKRINLDLFHVIADGNGALSFLNHLVINYLKLAHAGELDQVSVSSGSTSEERYQNSFDHFYDNSNGPIPKNILNKKKNAYQCPNRKLPYDQLQFFEVHLDASKIKAKSKELKVSVSSYLGAALMLSIKAGMPFMQRKKPVTISMPVNLRNYYPSETLRNFFNNIDVTHVFDGKEDIQTLATEFDATLKHALEPERIYDQMNRYQSMERVFFTRMVPLFIKQPVVKAFAKKEKKRVTAVLSNLGIIKFPEEITPYIESVSDFCSTESLFITVTTFGNDLVLGISSAYGSHGTLTRFIKILEETGTEVTAYVSEVVS